MARPSPLGPTHECELGSSSRARVWRRTEGSKLVARASAHFGLELAWIERGEVEYAIAGQRPLRARAGDAIIVPAQTEHRTTFLGAVEGGALWLAPEHVAQIADAIGEGGWPTQAARIDSAESIAPLGRALAAEIRGAGRGHLVASEAIAEAMTIAALRCASAPSARAGVRHPAVARALDRIHACYVEAITAEELAREAGMTRFAFTRIFSDEVGMPPYRYLLGVRLDRAAERLRGRCDSVTRAAYAAGFSDLGRFSRMFRKRFGCLPSEMRERARR